MTSSRFRPEQEALYRILGGVLEEFLEIPIKVEQPDGSSIQGPGVCVPIMGGWRGEVRAGATPEMVDAIAEAMYRRPGAVLNDEQRRDAISEVANMVAGNIKALLPSRSDLSLPEYRDGLEETGANRIRVTSGEGRRLWLAVDVCLEEEPRP